MANVKNAPNASRVSLYVPAENRYEDLLLWHMYRARCRMRGTSVFRQLVQFIRKDMTESPPTQEELTTMHEEARKHNVDAKASAPIADTAPPAPTENVIDIDFTAGA